MKTNFSLLFYMKKPKNFQKGLAPIYIRITVNTETVQKSLLAVVVHPPVGMLVQVGQLVQKKNLSL